MTAPGLPMEMCAQGLPTRVRIHEVGARDGLQNERTVVPTEVKAEFIHRLAAAGLPTVEATSFVHPKWVPQLADAEQLFPMLDDLDPQRLPVLVPNERGLDRALALGARRIAVFGSATESFAQANLNRTVDEALAMFAPVVARAKDAGVHVRGYLSMCFGDPWEGPVPVAQTVRVCRALLDLGCDELSLGDTIGVATPGHVQTLLAALNEAGVPTSVSACTSTTPTGRPSPTPSPRSSTASPPSTPRRAASAAARMPRAPPETSPPKTSCGCCTASASRPGSTWTV